MAEDILVGKARVHVLDDAPDDPSMAQEALLSALEEHAGNPESLIAELRSREALLALSRVRDNVLAWYDFPTNSSILEICDCNGSSAGAFCQSARRAVTILPDRPSALACAHAHAQSALEIWAGSALIALDELDAAFDFIVIHGVGVGDVPVLERAAGALAPGGRIIVTADNYQGYRQLASPPADMPGAFDCHGRPPALPLLSRARLEQLIVDCGLSVLGFWYAHPDRVFCRRVYSDARLPAAGELHAHASPSGTRRLRVLDEEALLRSFALERSFPQIAESFIVEAAKAPDAPCPVAFAKLSNERRRDLALVTSIGSDNSVRKRALYPEGCAHVDSLPHLHEQLEEQHAGRFAPNRIAAEQPGVVAAEFVEGHTLEDILVDQITSGNKDEASALLEEYRSRLQANAQERFQLTDAFLEVFGRQARVDEFALLDGIPCQKITDVDLILRNIIPDGNTWHLLDCEWTFDFPIPCAYVLWRSLFYLCYSKGVQAREAEYDFYRAWGFDDAHREIFFKMEVSLQQYLTDDLDSIDAILEQAAPEQLVASSLIAEHDAPAPVAPAAKGPGLISRFLRKG